MKNINLEDAGLFREFKRMVPEIITASMGFVASLAIVLASIGECMVSLRLIFLCLALDVLDGLFARALKAVSERGEFLDRLFDRLYQIVAPAIIYVQALKSSPEALMYASIIISGSFWRLSRRVPTREYFAGLPLFTHTILIVSSIISGYLIPPYIMIVLAILSIIPIKYYRRKTSFSHLENKGTFWIPRLLIPLILLIIPYTGVFSKLFLAIELAILAYIAFGWIPFLVKGGVKNLLHRKTYALYKF